MDARLKIIAGSIGTLLLLGGPIAAHAQAFKINQLIAPISQGLLYSSGVGTSTAVATTGPTVGYITATSTTATSTFNGALSISGNLKTNITGSTQCVRANSSGFLLGTGSDCGSGSGLTGTIGQVAYFSGTNTAVGTTSLNIATSGFVGIGTTTPVAPLSISTPAQTAANAPLFAIASTTGQMLYGLYPGGYVQAGPSASPDTTYCTFGKKCFGYFGSDNTLSGVNLEAGNTSNGVSAYSFLGAYNNLADSTGLHFTGWGVNSSAYNDATFGTGLNVGDLGTLQNSDGAISFAANINATTTANHSYFNWFLNGTAASNELMRLTTAGLGIGTNTPTVSLDIAGSAATTYTSPSSFSALRLRIANTNTTANNFEDLDFATNDTSGLLTSVARIVAINTSHSGVSGSLAFDVKNSGTHSEAMRITSTGLVGIGTTTPGAVLAISNSANTPLGTRLFMVASSTAGTATTSIFEIGTGIGGGNAFNAILHGTLSIPDTNSGVTVGTNGCFSWSNANTRICGNTSAPGNLNFQTGGVQVAAFLGEKFGIGTSSPYATLSVMAAGGSTAAGLTASTTFAIGSSTAGVATTTLFSVQSTGYTTIGSATGNQGNGGSMLNIEEFSASYAGFGLNINNSNFAFGTAALQVKGISLFDSGAITRTPISAFGRTGQTAALFSVGSTTSDYTGTGNYLTVAAGGNVGVGTTSPYAMLSVMAGDNYFSQPLSTVFAIGSSTKGTATSTLLAVLSDGTTGIGLQPSAAGDLLQVAGSVNTTGNYDISNGNAIRWGNTNSSITANSTSAFIAFKNSGAEVGRFQGTNFGVGTTTPFAALSVSSASTLVPTSLLFTVASTTNQPLFSINAAGMIFTSGNLAATSTSITIDWSSTPPLVEYQMSTSAYTINIINATTSLNYGSRKTITLCNNQSSGAGGAATFTGAEGLSGYTQTTTAGQCDNLGFMVQHATSTSAYKVFFVGASTGLQ